MTLFMATLLNGLSLAALYFIVASGFTLIFGLMRIVNLAHGALYLLGGYVGFEVQRATGSWYGAVVAGFAAIAAVGLVLQLAVFRHMEGQELRQTLVSLALSIIAADLMLWVWGGDTYQITTPDYLFGAFPVGLPGLPMYPTMRLVTILVAVVVGIALWLFLTRTRLGMIIRAGVDDRDMVQASGINVHAVFAVTFAIGAGLAGLAGVIGGSVLSIAPGEDLRFLLISLIVVIVGGMGSVAGSALGALLIGLAEQFGLAYTPTYGVVYTFLILVAVLALRPQGLLGRA
ncbi:branched-chain amino acid ABC transporter permease [Rhodosalinus sp.]|uniref:branched-chain amino acid ABC transporter permease n=1 Tax=Rhodosalinus sp. TaxID=2047741 RepID=UPI0035651A45